MYMTCIPGDEARAVASDPGARTGVVVAVSHCGSAEN